MQSISILPSFVHLCPFLAFLCFVSIVLSHYFVISVNSIWPLDQCWNCLKLHDLAPLKTPIKKGEKYCFLSNDMDTNNKQLCCSVEVRCLRHPSTIGNQPQPWDCSNGWQNLTTQPWAPMSLRRQHYNSAHAQVYQTLTNWPQSLLVVSYGQTLLNLMKK